MPWRAGNGQGRFPESQMNCVRLEPDNSLETILSSIVIDHLRKEFGNENKPVIYLYLDEKDSTTHTLANLFGSLLKQLIQIKHSDTIPADLQRLYERTRREEAKSWQEFFGLLKTEILTYERVYVVVDALDECPLKSREQLERELRELQKLQPGKLSLMVTAREPESEAASIFCDNCGASELRIYFHCDICNDGHFDLCQTCRKKGVTCKDESHRSYEPYGAVEVEIKTRDEDMERYIKHEIGDEIDDNESELRDKRRHPKPRNATTLGQECMDDPELLNTIISVVAEKAEGKLLFAKLYMDQLKHAKTLEDIKTALDSFPKELDKLYEVAMERIQGQADPDNREIALNVLSRLTRAHRPLTLAELQHILATKPGDTDFNKAKRHRRELILPITSGLIGISDYDENAVVRILHFSLYQYLDKTRNRWFPKAEVDMAIACLTYLNFSALSKPCQDVEEFDTKKRAYPFIAYASQYWGDHVRDAGPDPSIEAMTVRFLNEPFRVTACIQAAWSTESGGSDTWDVCTGAADLHVCAWFGLASVIAALERGVKSLQIDIRDMTYEQTPLMYACRRGHVEVVRQLLDRGAAINLVSTLGRTAMFEAVMQNRGEVVKLLLDKAELNINAAHTKECDQTALMLAARLGQSSMVGDLLTRLDIEPNLQDSNGCTALYLAVYVESYRTVETLLANAKVDVDVVDNIGRSALFVAAMRNNCDIVKLLRENHADPSLKDKQGGGTALLRAIDFGNFDVVEWMLSDLDVDLACVDSEGRSLLHGASISGNAEIVGLLGEGDEIDLDARDKNGLTALHDASREGHEEVVQKLLGLGANKAVEDLFGRTPLRIALEYGQTQIACILQDASANQHVDPTSAVDAKSFPIWLLVKGGLLDQVAQAIAIRKSDLSMKEPVTENTALHYAVLDNKIDILRMLLTDTDMSPNPINRYQRTPLHLAALNSHFEATEILLHHHAEVDLKDEWGYTPLFLAQSEASQADKHFPIALALIEAGANTDAINVQKMFFAAIELGRVAAVQALLDKGADALGQDGSGRKAIELARVAGNTQIVQILQSSKSFRYSELKRKPEQASRRVRHPRVKPNAGTDDPREQRKITV